MAKTNGAKLKIVVALIIAALIFVTAVYALIMQELKTAEKISVGDADKNWPNNTVYSFSVNVEDEMLKINGFVFVVGSDTFNINNFVCLYSKYDDVYYKIPTKMVIDEQASAVTNDGYNYGRSGFNAAVPLKELPEDIGELEICFYYKNDDFNNILHTEHLAIEGEYSELEYTR